MKWPLMLLLLLENITENFQDSKKDEIKSALMCQSYYTILVYLKEKIYLNKYILLFILYITAVYFLMTVHCVSVHNKCFFSSSDYCYCFFMTFYSEVYSMFLCSCIFICFVNSEIHVLCVDIYVPFPGVSSAYFLN